MLRSVTQLSTRRAVYRPLPARTLARAAPLATKAVDGQGASRTAEPGSASTPADKTAEGDDATAPPPPPPLPPQQTKTMAELDEETRRRMSSVAGDGGDAGVEYEDGKPVGMKRGVSDNMFRYI